MTATQRRRWRRRATRGSAAALAGLLLAGCTNATGITGTDVFEVGDPGRITAYGGTMLLYFRDRNGVLTPVLRTGPFEGADPGSGSGTSGTYKIPAGLVLMMLMKGPNNKEAAASLGTDLPATDIAVGDTERQAGLLTVRLPFPVSTLGETARSQLVCTAVHAEPRDEDAKVVLVGKGDSVPAQKCPVSVR
ncbi:hypothetical protein [Streptomyces sp. NPDC097981]|uniref:hypothetical protein n=1 Tax=Streptomyces sp. NPDC097981 TaxID=3155428 RepID=UPI00332B8D4C